MKAVVLDMTFQINNTTRVNNKEPKSADKDFTTSLESAEDKIKANETQVKESRNIKNNKEISNSKKKPNDELKSLEEETLESNEGTSLSIMYEHLANLIGQDVDLVKDFNSTELGTNLNMQSIEYELINPGQFAETTLMTNDEMAIGVNHNNNEDDFSKASVNLAGLSNEDKTIGLMAVKEGINISSDSNNDEELLIEKDVNLKKISDDEDLLSRDNNTNNEYSLETIRKKPELELSEEKEFDSSSKNSQTETSPQVIFSSKNEVITLRDNSVDLEKVEQIDKKDLLNQIVEKVKIDFQSPKNEIRIKLKPEILGEITMKIEVDKGAIVAKILVDNPKTKEIIEGNIIQLKEDIKDTGLEIKTFEVFVGNDGDLDKHSFNHFNFNQNNKKYVIRSTGAKASLSYDENLNEASKDLKQYGESSLNLLA